jgi:hypothetical protein
MINRTLQTGRRVVAGITYLVVSLTPAEPVDSPFSVPTGYTVQPPAEDP